MLCGNKSDLRGEAFSRGRFTVSREHGEKTARDVSAIFIETSSKEGENMLETVVALAR